MSVCEICGTLPAQDTARYLSSTLPAGARALEREGLGWVALASDGRRLERCPRCGAWFIHSRATCPTDDLEIETIEARRRIGPIEALTFLDLLGDAAGSERARIEEEVEALVAGLAESLRSSGAREALDAACELARYHRRGGAWSEVEALLRDRNPSVLAGAARLLAAGGAPRPPATVVRALEALLDEPPLAGEPGEDPALSACQALAALEGSPELDPVLPSLIDRLDAEHRHGQYLDLVLATHFRLLWESAWRLDHQARPVAPELLARVPALVRHIVAPRTRPPTSRYPFTHPTSTDHPAKRALAGMAVESAEAAAAIRAALAERPGASELWWRFLESSRLGSLEDLREKLHER